MYQICCIGHITLDKVITPNTSVEMAGGTSFYFSSALQNMDAGYLLVTALAASEIRFVDNLRSKGIEVKVLPSAHTVCFENIYTENQDERKQNVLQKADPFSVDQLNDINADIFHLGPLLADDIPLEVIDSLASRAKVALDVQGYLRKVENNKVYPVDWPEKLDALKYVHTLKASETEAEVLTGSNDLRQSAQVLANWGVEEVIITMGSQGSLIYANDSFFEIPAYVPAAVVDATGCGDTYMAGYLYQRSKGAGIQQAGEFAAAMASIKIETAGPFNGTEADVLYRTRGLHTH